MGTKYETGHAMNIGNFHNIVIRCSGFGGAYNPSNVNISVTNMITLWQKATALLIVCNKAEVERKIPIRKKNVLLSVLKKTARRALESYESTNASRESKYDVKGWVSKMTGTNVKRKKNLKPGKKWVSNSEQGIDKVMDSFDRMIEFLKLDGFYAPLETELQVATMDGLLGDLKAAYQTVIDSNVNAQNRRTDRDICLYGKDTGMVDVAQACKKYVMSLYGAKSTEARMVTGIKLRRMVRDV